MVEIASFQALLPRLKRRILMQEVRRGLKTAVLLALILGLVEIGLVKLFGLAWAGWSAHVGLVLLAALLAALHTLRTFPGVLEELRRLDQRLGLKDRLSTAYECHRAGRKSLFVGLLYQDAARQLADAPEPSWFPFSFSRFDLLIPALAVVLVVVLFVSFPGPSMKTSTEKQLLGRVSQKMAAFARPEKKAPSQPKEEKRPSEAYEKLRNLAEAAQNEKMDRQELTKQLGDMLESLKEKRLGQVQRLEAELSPTEGASMAQLRPLGKQEVRPEDVRQVQAQLEPYFGGELPGSLARSLGEIEESGRVEAFLQEALKDLGAGKSEQARPLDLAENAPAGGRSSGEDRSQGQPEGKGSSPGSDEKTAPSTGEKQGAAQGGDQTPTDQAGDRAEKNEDNAPYVAGVGTSKEKTAPSELKGTTRQPEPDAGLPGQGERYSIHVRSLPAPVRAGASEEEVLRPYEKAAAEALRREDIPPAFRAYIKNYFLAIGLGREATGGKDDHGRRSPD